MNPTSFVIVAAVVSSTTATAQSIEFVFDSSASSATTGLEFAVPLTGTLIGDYDAKGNPGGTQTRPGLFGGSGNNPIDCDLTIAVVGDPTPTAPAGSLVVDFDELEASQMVVESFRLDLLDGSTTSIGGELRPALRDVQHDQPVLDLSRRHRDPDSAHRHRFFGEARRPGWCPVVRRRGRRGDRLRRRFLPVTWSIEFDAGTGTQSQEIPAAIPFAGTISGGTGDRTLLRRKHLERRFGAARHPRGPDSGAAADDPSGRRDRESPCSPERSPASTSRSTSRSTPSPGRPIPGSSATSTGTDGWTRPTSVS